MRSLFKKETIQKGLAVFSALLFLFHCSFVAAQVDEGEVKGDVAVNAVVPSKVDKSKSENTIHPTEVLADNIQRAIVTVKLKDSNGTPLPDIKVKLTSNRGTIDNIKEVNTGKDIATTDAEGVAYLEVTSSIPGEVVLTTVVDALVTLSPLKLTFLPLPFPKNVTISAEVPKFISPSGEITLSKPEEKPDKIVNMGVNIRIPFWLILLILSSILANIGLFILVVVLFFKMRKTEEKEEEILEKEEEMLEQITENGTKLKD